MDRIENIINLANDNMHRSVVKINPDIKLQEKDKDKDYLTFGVKNTADIPKDFISRFRNNSRYLWTTIDRMSHLGRSIDTELINPLTYRAMTGSSSGSAINILKGINDFAICTDGGGSVLAPALSCNLFSFLGSGIGLLANKASESTDKIPLTPGVGIISKDFHTLKEVIDFIIPNANEEFNINKLKVVVPKKNTVAIPDGRDMYETIVAILKEIPMYNNISLVEYDFKDITNRGDSIEDIKRIFENSIGDLILSFEGPIDVLGYDETIQRGFNGKVEKEITSKGGKALVKSANICKCSAITIPTDNLASGLLVCAPEGVHNLRKALYFSEIISNNITRPDIFLKYFIRREKKSLPLDF